MKSQNTEKEQEVPELTSEEIENYVSPDGYVDPAVYGAKGDGVTDDSAALQMAIDSGYNVRLQDRTYLIAQNQTIRITGKSDFHMEGGIIHREASPDNYQLFVLTDCEGCSFSDMYIYSEFTYEDILIPKNHTRPSDTRSSNVLAFSGTGNSDILFQNNRFDYMASDYWFNATDDRPLQNIIVDGWYSTSSLLPMYTQCLQGLTVKNAQVALHPGCGDGDHCIYVCYKTSDVCIEDSVFTGNDSENLQGAVVVLTFHGGNEKNGTQPQNITIRSCTLNALTGRALYCETGTDLKLLDCVIKQETNDSDSAVEQKTIIFGTGMFSFSNCIIEGADRIFEGMTSLSLADCTISGAAENALISNVNVVDASGCSFTCKGGAAVYMNESSRADQVYEACTFFKSGDAQPYLFSDRASDGTILLRQCTGDLNQHWFAYDGKKGSFPGYILDDTEFDNCLGKNMGEEDK